MGEQTKRTWQGGWGRNWDAALADYSSSDEDEDVANIMSFQKNVRAVAELARDFLPESLQPSAFGAADPRPPGTPRSAVPFVAPSREEVVHHEGKDAAHGEAPGGVLAPDGEGRGRGEVGGEEAAGSDAVRQAPE